MVKKILFSLLVVMTGLIIISCNGLVIPSKVQVKGSPSVYAPLGSKTVTLSEYLNTDDIIKMMGADQPDSTMKVYEYPFTAGTQADATASPVVEFAAGVADDNMRFLVHYPLTSFDLDFTEYLDKLNFAQDFSNNLPEQVFTVPSIDSPPSQTIDFNGVLLTTLNVIPSFPVTVASVPGVYEIPPVPLNLTGFETATFSAGSMNLEITVEDATGLTLTGVRILSNTDSTELASATGVPVPLSGTVNVSIPLIDVEFTKTMQIAFKVNATGVTFGSLQVKPSFTEATRLSAATGVVLVPQRQNISPINIPAINDPLFVQATVGTGNITMDIGLADPDGEISGFIQQLTLNVTQTGGLNAGVTDDTADPHVIPLAGETINTEAIALSGEVNLFSAVGGASFENLGTTGLVFSVAPSININQYSSVTVKPGTGFEFEKTITEPLSQDLRDWVTAIEFAEVGLKLTFTNGLPAGNDIGITVNSDAFGIINRTDSLLATNPPISEPYSFTNAPYTFIPADHENIDFTFALTPPGYNSVDGTMTLINLAPGEEFGFKVDDLEMVSEWTEIVIDPQNGFEGTYPEVGGDPLDLSTITDYLGNDLGFEDIPMYLYISGTDFSGTAFITATYKDKLNISKTTSLLPSGTAIEEVTPLEILQTSGRVNNPLSQASVTIPGFSTILNDGAKDLSLNYTIDVAAMHLTKTEIELNPVKTFNADLVIVLPLAFKADGPLPKEIAIIEFDSLMGENPTDLLGRKEGEEDKSLDDVFENLKSMAMKLDINNNLGLKGTLVVSAGTGADTFRKELIMGDPGFKQSRLDLTKDNIEFIKRNNPFTPSFSLEIPNGTYHLKKNAGMDVNITLSIETDIDYSIDLQGGK